MSDDYDDYEDEEEDEEFDEVYEEPVEPTAEPPVEKAKVEEETVDVTPTPTTEQPSSGGCGSSADGGCKPDEPKPPKKHVWKKTDKLYSPPQSSVARFITKIRVFFRKKWRSFRKKVNELRKWLKPWSKPVIKWFGPWWYCFAVPVSVTILSQLIHAIKAIFRRIFGAKIKTE